MTLATSYKLKSYACTPVAVEHDVPPPKGREALVKIRCAGVCHSDVYIMDGYQDLGNGERMEFDGVLPLPLTMGHEISGDVVAVGPDADPTLVGARRLVYPWIGCGKCPACKAGVENHCQQAKSLGVFSDGGYSDYVLVPDQRYLIDIEGLDSAWATTLSCSGLTVYSAIRQLQPIPPEGRLAVMGVGGLGLMAVAVARALGVKDVVACDVNAERLETARKMGAAETVDVRRPDALQALVAASGERLTSVIDTVGLPSTLQLAMDAVIKGSRIVLIGLQGGRLSLPVVNLPFKALAIIGTYTGSLAELQEVVALAKAGAIPAMPIWTRPMSMVGDSLERLRRGGVVGRIILSPDAPPETATA
jgi:D-arabinose 1-dehydrogenase-like Zn-dependent alcohol dehydrogenase